ncbi:hypothetical protein A8709_06450 [Paenibacillus pectinilyticus]|uniref:Uncharacterized protein n=1 Tax=Paenibacillus pectinilyticus TaxID=512399 RepID=A0A1C0ZTC3_9BACL|nr:hypothetical protein A8709_06450 [Paenibacillus pectinilyticus]
MEERLALIIGCQEHCPFTIQTSKNELGVFIYDVYPRLTHLHMRMPAQCAGFFLFKGLVLFRLLSVLLGL